MDLMDNNIMNRIQKNVTDRKNPMSMFHYELTESAYADITEGGCEFLTSFQKEGAKILIDDFGSGCAQASSI